MKTVRILEDSAMFVSESKYSISDTISVSEYLNRIFMMSTSNRILKSYIYDVNIQSYLI